MRSDKKVEEAGNMEVIFQFSRKGSGKYNEDVLGSYQNYFWVIDGATDLFHKNIISGDNDVFWLVHKISERLPLYCNDDKELVDVLYDVTSEISSDIHNAGIDINTIYDYELPTYAIAFGRIINNKLQYYILGDCTIKLFDGKSVNIITDKRLVPFSKHNRDALKELKDKGIWSIESEQQIYQKTRMLANTPNGYWIGALNTNGIRHGITGELLLLNQAKILCYSDGFGEYYSVFHEMTKCDDFSKDGLVSMIQALDVFLNHDTKRDILIRPRKIDDLSVLLISK